MLTNTSTAIQVTPIRGGVVAVHRKFNKFAAHRIDNPMVKHYNTNNNGNRPLISRSKLQRQAADMRHVPSITDEELNSYIDSILAAFNATAPPPTANQQEVQHEKVTPQPTT